ncbi:MAG: peptidoglycan bridge formation glycyltransferase FemA/FemB family protein [Treponema sp.]|nr:peptidoglycan bridge formation glycyltransferase FemA/FemB family protein [Treponema sp.]
MRFQQTDFWTFFKCNHGWEKVSADFSMKNGEKQCVNILYRIFKIGFFRSSLAYIPMAPEFESDSPEDLKDEKKIAEYLERVGKFSTEIKNALPKNTICIRYDFPLDYKTVEERDESVKKISSISKKARLNIKKSNVDIQPPDSTWLDLSKSEDEILATMKSKWRYNVRLAQKKGVQVRAVHFGDENFERDLDSFYELYKTTAERDGIGLHPKGYYRDLLCRGANSMNARLSKSGKTEITLYIASHTETDESGNEKTDDLAAIITLFQDDEAIYLYGCSGNIKRNLMPAYLTQWTAICDAKKFGSKIYDFYGIPPTGDENHPMHGLYLFKTGFGGEEVHRPGSFDFKLSWIYSLYIKAENFRAWYHKKFLKKIRGR